MQTKFSDDVPASIVNLKSLVCLSLSTEGISKQFPLITKLTSLDSLELQGSGLQKPNFSWIGDLRNLTSLSIENYNFSEPIPSWIGNLKTLTSLRLNGCNFYGPIPSFIGNLTQLSSLAFDNNYLTGKLLRMNLTLPLFLVIHILPYSTTLISRRTSWEAQEIAWLALKKPICKGIYFIVTPIN
jgi:hypothetical protein